MLALSSCLLQLDQGRYPCLRPPASWLPQASRLGPCKDRPATPLETPSPACVSKKSIQSVQNPDRNNQGYQKVEKQTIYHILLFEGPLKNSQVELYVILEVLFDLESFQKIVYLVFVIKDSIREDLWELVLQLDSHVSNEDVLWLHFSLVHNLHKFLDQLPLDTRPGLKVNFTVLVHSMVWKYSNKHWSWLELNSKH